MKKLLFIGLVSTCCCSALAGNGQGTIAKVEHGPLYGTKVFISLDGSVSGQPACRTDGVYHFVFDTAAPGGKDMLASLLLAKATNQSVSVSGYNQCTLNNGVEDLRWFRLE